MLTIEHPLGTEHVNRWSTYFSSSAYALKIILIPHLLLKMRTYQKIPDFQLQKSEDGFIWQIIFYNSSYLELNSSFLHICSPRFTMSPHLASFTNLCYLLAPVDIVFPVAVLEPVADSIVDEGRGPLITALYFYSVEEEGMLYNTISPSLVCRPLVGEVKIIFILIVSCFFTFFSVLTFALVVQSSGR